MILNRGWHRNFWLTIKNKNGNVANNEPTQTDQQVECRFVELEDLP